jgi:hypothetical protein
LSRTNSDPSCELSEELNHPGMGAVSVKQVLARNS